MGGIPCELGTAGFGIGVAIEAAFNLLKSYMKVPKELSDATVAIHGFGTLGSGISRYLNKKGSKIVAISDQWNTVYHQNGINIENALEYSNALSEKTSLKKYKPATVLPIKDIVKIDCDLFVSASGKNLLNDKTIPLLKAEYFVEEINDPLTSSINQFLNNNGVFVLSNILTDIGNAICSNAEYNRNSVELAFSCMESKVKEIVELVVERSLETNIPNRQIAQEIAQEKILNARRKT